MAADDDNGDGTSLFDIFSASPLKHNDEGSLDIYAGLDSTISDSTSKSCVSFRNCLDLYEEILTEEGTAKEATYNDLQVEYGKCQLQMKELMKKFKEIQTQNLNLKNENQSLKKNISALIKTARVEINRKDEEINNLHQRLSEFPPFRNNKTTRISDVVKIKDVRSRSPFLDGCSESDHRIKSDVSKDVHLNSLLPNLGKEGKLHSEAQNSLHLPTRIEKHCANGFWSRSDHQVGEGNSNENNRRERKDIRHGQYSRGTDRTQKDVNSSCGLGESKNKEDSPRLQGNPEKHGNGEAKAKSKHSKFKSTDGIHKSERSNNCVWEKVTSRERSHARVESQNDKNLERQSERLQNTSREELQSLDKAERKTDTKLKALVKNQEHWRRSDRALLSHSKNEIKSYNSSKYHPEEKRGREDCKRDRGISSHGFHDGRSSSSLASSKTNKYLYSKEVSVTHHWENIPERQKVERHRTEERRKRERENKEENRHMRKDKKSPTEHLQKTNKEAKKTTVDLKRQNEPKNDKGEISNEVSKGTGKEFAVKAENGPSETKNKDLKLSFMEKLNLTLSPAKKQPVSQDNQHQLTDDPKSSGVCDSESPEKTKIVTCVPSVNEHNTNETRSKLLEPNDALPISELGIGVPESKVEEENTSLVKSVENIPCEMFVCDTELSFSTPMEMKQTRSLFPLEVEKTNVGARAATSIVIDVLPTDASQNLDSSDISEGMEMKVVLSTKTVENNESLLQPSVEEAAILPVNHAKDSNPSFEPSLADIPMVENKSCHMEPCLPAEPLASLPQQAQSMDHMIEIGETNSVYHDDENSVLSIDLNHLRPIPEAISPLNSPVRPVAKILRMESPTPISLCNSRHKDMFPSAHSTYKNNSDLNKENHKPVPKFDKCTEANSCKNSFLDELEEGEIRSDSEESIPQKDCGQSTNSRASAEVQNIEPSPGDGKNTVHSHKDDSKMSVKIHQNNNKCDKRPSEPSKTEKKDKTMSISTLEKILPIIPAPSSVWEIMHMLRMIGKHVRKNYMKFKVKFSLIQFHRIIESATLSFTSLIKYLDLSKICKSVTTLQNNLCDIIECNLKQVKKNGIVDRLFEQQQPDMKKKLWKFVDEQLDYLFEKLKKILVKFCDSLSFGIDNSEGKPGKRYKEKTQYSNCHKKNLDNYNKEMQRKQLPKLENSMNYKSLLLCKKKEEKLHDKNNINVNTVEHNIKRSFNTCFDNIKSSESEEQSLELNCPSTPKPGRLEGSTIEDTQITQHTEFKPERSFEILTEQQASSLTFNLVSDAQMGEIFKSLLQGSDLLDSSGNCTEKNEWELKTPEKPILESMKGESTPTCTTEELVAGVASPCPKVISDDNWSLLSSEKGPSLSSGLALPVHPDVLDENCMFEALSKDNVCSSEKSKPCISSILFEDLAVSLTVPSPLKSDGHLSFLKPEVLPSSTPEEVISAHFSEDALLEEEDASEQDIHLALESDNSSSKSSCSSWTSRSVAPGFQYHPNLPMHAVIMEKSNDHFIVKIRRAAPSTSPTRKHSKMPEGSVASLPIISKEADEISEKEPISCQSIVFKAAEDLENSDKNVDSSESTHKEQNSVIQTQAPSACEFLKDASSKVGHCDEVADDCLGLHQVWEPKAKKLEELPSMEKIPHAIKDDLPTTCIDLTKDPVTETKNFGELLEVTVLNIDHLEYSEPNLDQSAQILGKSLQPDTTDAFIDLTQDATNESKNEGSDPMLAVEGLECQVICVDEDNCKEEMMLSTKNPLNCIVEETCIDLTPESPGSCEIKKDALKSELPLNSDSLMLPGTLDNAHKKRKNCFGLNHSLKRQRKETDLTSKEKIKKFSQDSGEDEEANGKKSNKKKAPAVNISLKTSPGINDSDTSLGTSPVSLSAKNVIKRKGEVIISWTRNDDREILLECQKRLPSLKTFTYLAVKLNKNPNQVSERFQQLKKLFEKSKCR